MSCDCCFFDFFRIIPFVAADALDSRKDVSKEEPIYDERNKPGGNSFEYANLFSPPAETQGMKFQLHSYVYLKDTESNKCMII